ncbi:hypothetical protein HNR23_000220 [Nocardiopsis mwathae]|uniref:Uncharacterized protein n=1 Tax=Nocardiopsis mwathae TaxID=1472723 RepID=A0A7W9YDU8_9ACTN|nr:hypothetical protein [Nocardiopsis mwathae]MBB6170160.1 hypothetical protein [Nocardiopsis mwathae]
MSTGRYRDSDGVVDFFFGDWNITDQRQNRQIRDLEENLYRARQAASRDRHRLHSELSQVRGSLEKRLDAISASFDAFVELSDIRAELALFGDTALTRHRTRQMLDGERPDELRLDDPSGYWLVPAAHGLHALTGGDVGTAQARFADAAQRNAVRGRVFAILATAVTAPQHLPEVGAPLCAHLLPELPHGVTRWQRALWLLTADGLLGTDARDELRFRTQAALRENGLPTGGDMWRIDVPRSRTEQSPVVLTGTEGIHERIHAAARLTALRERLERALGDPTPAGPAGTGTPAAAPAPSVAETLRLLIDEGSPGEAPLLERAVHLRAIIENSGSAPATPQRPRWEAEVGRLDGLLLTDSTDPSAPFARREFAFSFGGTQAVAMAESLAEQAQEPWTGPAMLTEQGERLGITRQGPDRQALRDVEARIMRRYSGGGSERRNTTLFSAAVGVFLVALALVFGSVLAWIGGIAAFGFAGWALFQDGTDRDRTQEYADHQCERMREAAESGTRHLIGLLHKADAAASGASQDLEAIRRLIPQG